MRRRFAFRRPSPGTALGGLALIVAMGGVAGAAVVNSDGSINGCYTIRGGQLRLIDPAAGESCSSREVAISLASTDATGKVANADKLDGKDSTAFLSQVITRTAVETIPPGVARVKYAWCLEGEKAVGGGGETVGNGPIPVLGTMPVAKGQERVERADEIMPATGWMFRAHNPTSTDARLWVSVLCAAG